VDEMLAKLIVARLTALFPTFGETVSDNLIALRIGAWLTANQDLPSDLWAEAERAVLRANLKGMPSPGQFRAYVEPQLDRRRRALERLGSWQRIKTAPAPNIETREQRMRGLRDSYRRIRDHVKAAKFERDLAEIEGRPAEFTDGELEHSVPKPTAESGE